MGGVGEGTARVLRVLACCALCASPRCRHLSVLLPPRGRILTQRFPSRGDRTRGCTGVYGTGRFMPRKPDVGHTGVRGSHTAPKTQTACQAPTTVHPTHWTPLHTVQTNMLRLGTTYWGPCACREWPPVRSGGTGFGEQTKATQSGFMHSPGFHS